MEVKNVTKQDAEKLLGVYSYYVEQTAISFEYVTPTVEEFQERIETISAKYPYLKAVDDNGNLLGYAYASAFKGRAAYDRSVETTVYVDKNHKGEGIGKALYEVLEKSLQDMGILNMNACIAMPVGSDPYLSDDSFKFHSKMGFTKVAHFHLCAYKFTSWYDMIWMEKFIGEHKESPEQIRWKP